MKVYQGQTVPANGHVRPRRGPTCTALWRRHKSHTLETSCSYVYLVLPARVVRLFRCCIGPQTACSPASCPVQLQSNPPAGLHGEDLGLSALLKGTSAVVPPPWSNLSTRLPISSNLKSKVYSYRPSRLVFVEMYDCKQRRVKKSSRWPGAPAEGSDEIHQTGFFFTAGTNLGRHGLKWK